MQHKTGPLSGTNASGSEPDWKDRLPFWVLGKQGFSLAKAGELP